MKQRYFQKPNGEHINDRVQAVVFGEDRNAWSIDKNGNRRNGSLWSLEDTLGLVASGIG